jgi:hypothetical protein
MPGWSRSMPGEELRVAEATENGTVTAPSVFAVPQVSFPKGWGAIRGIGEKTDVFILSGSEDLVSSLERKGASWTCVEQRRGGWRVTRYRPRVEGLFAVTDPARVAALPQRDTLRTT